MITPVNGHLVIEPIKHETFVASAKGTYEEIGIVIANSSEVHPTVGTKVFFDAWLAAKYPKNDQGEYYWLVKWSDVRAVEHVNSEAQHA